MEKNGQSRKCQWVLLSSVEGVEEFPEADFYIPDYYQPLSTSDCLKEDLLFSPQSEIEIIQTV